jgi:simple sugar transport system permease protein
MSFIARTHQSLLATGAVLVVLFGAASFYFDNFCSSYVISDLFSENAFLGISALGMTLVLLAGGIDLSVGAVIGFTTIFVATLISQYQLSPWWAWVIALMIGTAYGAAMGATIHFFKLPAFLVTLAGLFFARGMAFLVTQESVQIRNETYESISQIAIPFGQAEIGFTTIVFLAVLGAMAWITNFSTFGRNVLAIGGNEESALLMGLPVARTKVAVYAINGFCSALAGIAMTLYMDSGNPINAIGLELDVIAVVVIGGTLLSGGVGSFTGTLQGFLIYGTIYQITYFANMGSSIATIAIGGLLLAFILLQQRLATR